MRGDSLPSIGIQRRIDMKYEKPQKRNPYRLTISQHIFPARSIERFTDDAGMVEVRIAGQNKVVRLPPKSALFCAKRRWDQRAETGYMKKIEDAFQSLAAKVVDNHAAVLSEADSRIATDFFALWYLRSYRDSHPIGDVQLKGVIGGERFTKDEEERLEERHVTFIRGENALVSSRFMTGLNIQMGIDRIRSQAGGLRWGVVCSLAGEFIVPETFSNVAILPISPKLILAGNSRNLLASPATVVEVNRLAISCCRTYYFSRRLSNCPL
jgi:hypothetical protein